jgi:hypothetical protein
VKKYAEISVTETERIIKYGRRAGGEVLNTIEKCMYSNKNRYNSN